jgi:hypothetical protein
MSDTTVIKEFLVALGYKQDEAALKKFSDGIDKATTAVFRLAAAVSGTALTVAIGVERFASNLEILYFAAQRTGSSATNLKAFARAAQDFGASNQDALSSVEGFAQFLRNNPGGAGLLEALGVQTRDPKTGQLRDTSDVLADLGNEFAKMPTYLASQYAGQFGISDRMMLALRNGDFASDMEKIRQSLKDAGFNQTSKDAHQFMMDLRDLGDQLQAFGLKAEEAILKHFGVSLKTVTQYLRDHGDELSTKIANGIERILQFADKAKDFFVWLFGMLQKLDSATDGWSTKIGGILLLLRALGAGGIVSGILGLAGAFLQVTAAVGGLTAALATLGGYELGKWLNNHFPNSPMAKLGDFLGNKFYDLTHQDEIARQVLSDHGFSRWQQDAILANLNRESGLRAHSSAIDSDGKEHYGIAQWGPERQADFARWAGHDIHGTGIEEQLGFLSHEMHDKGGDAGARDTGMFFANGTDNAFDAAEYFSRHFERPANGDIEAQKRGEAAVNLSAQTHITIDGAKDPTAIADEVKRAQLETAAALTRNLQGAVQ